MHLKLTNDNDNDNTDKNDNNVDDYCISRHYGLKFVDSPLLTIRLKEQYRFSYVNINGLECDQTTANELWKRPSPLICYPSREIKKTLPFMYISRGLSYTITQL